MRNFNGPLCVGCTCMKKVGNLLKWGKRGGAPSRRPTKIDRKPPSEKGSISPEIIRNAPIFFSIRPYICNVI